MIDEKLPMTRVETAQNKRSLSNTNLPWVEKYRPSTLSQVSHHATVIETLQKFVREGRLPHLLFYGPPGTGKTSSATALARDIFGKEFGSMVLELNASDDRGIAVVREEIKTFASTKNLSFFSPKQKASDGGHSFKIVILDECDAMTSSAQNALRRVLEKYIKNVRFIMICNYVGQIIPALQSRCTKFRFSPLPTPTLRQKIGELVASEGLPRVTDQASDAIIHLAEGDMRRIINVLQASSAACSGDAKNGGGAVIDENLIYAITAAPHPADMQNILQVLLNNSNFQSALCIIQKIQEEKGLALIDIVRAIHSQSALFKFPLKMKLYLIKELAELEHRLCSGTFDNLQTPALVGIFIIARSFLKA